MARRPPRAGPRPRRAECVPRAGARVAAVTGVVFRAATAGAARRRSRTGSTGSARSPRQRAIPAAPGGVGRGGHRPSGSRWRCRRRSACPQGVPKAAQAPPAAGSPPECRRVTQVPHPRQASALRRRAPPRPSGAAPQNDSSAERRWFRTCSANTRTRSSPRTRSAISPHARAAQKPPSRREGSSSASGNAAATLATTFRRPGNDSDRRATKPGAAEAVRLHHSRPCDGARAVARSSVGRERPFADLVATVVDLFVL